MIFKSRVWENWVRFISSARFFWKALRFSVWILSLAVLLTFFFLGLNVSKESSPSAGFIAGEWILVFLLLLLTAAVMPYLLKALFFRLEPLKSFLKKRMILSVLATLLPLFFGFCILGLLFLLPGKTVMSSVFFAAWCVLLLTIWSICFSIHISAGQTIDTMRLIFNGMEMASKLDFDHPIVTIRQDEIGSVSGQFNHMLKMLKTRVNVLQALFDNIRVFSGMLKKEKIIDHSIESFKSLEEAGEIVIALWDEEQGRMVVEKSSVERPEAVGLQFSPGEGVLGQMIKTPQFLAWAADEYSQTTKDCEKEKILWGKPSCVVCLPMLFKGILKGAVVFYDVDLQKFAEDRKADYLQGLTNQIAIFLENARLYRMVIQDRLTGLYVHSFIEAEIENLLAQASRYKFPVSFIMFDVDKFKQINDKYGHTAGNLVLRAVAQTIRSVSRDADSAGRYGGDEFEVILPHTDKEGARVYTEKLRKSIEQLEVEVAEGVKVKVTISVGLAAYPQDAQSSMDLQAAADSALYGAKAMGRNCVVLYETIKK